MSTALDFHLVDVFAQRRHQGNGLAVVRLTAPCTTATLLAITRELRQFETIFVLRRTDGSHDARVFTLEEELPFAGHPVLGAAAVIAHDAGSPTVLHLAQRTLEVHVRPHGNVVEAWMNQGRAMLAMPRSRGAVSAALRALGLSAEDAHSQLPAQVGSTGLAYLVLPVQPAALARIRVDGAALAAALADAGAEFVYVVAVGEVVEGRTWSRTGTDEDAATGSAAGPVAAWLVAHGHLPAGATLALRQGRFVHRPSLLRARVQDGDAWVGGEVWPSGEGRLHLE